MQSAFNSCQSHPVLQLVTLALALSIYGPRQKFRNHFPDFPVYPVDLDLKIPFPEFHFKSRARSTPTDHTFPFASLIFPCTPLLSFDLEQQTLGTHFNDNDLSSTKRNDIERA